MTTLRPYRSDDTFRNGWLILKFPDRTFQAIKEAAGDQPVYEYVRRAAEQQIFGYDHSKETNENL